MVYVPRGHGSTIGKNKMKEILDLIEEYKQADVVTKLEIRVKFHRLFKDTPTEKQLRLINKLDERGIELIIPCGIKGEVYAKAIKRLFDLRRKSNKKEVIDHGQKTK